MAKHKDRMHNLFVRWSRRQPCGLSAKNFVKSARHLQNTEKNCGSHRGVRNALPLNQLCIPFFENVR